MARRKHQEGKAVDASQRFYEQNARATLGTMWEMTITHRAVMDVWTSHQRLKKGKQAVTKDEIEDQVKSGVPKNKAAEASLFEAELKITRALRDLFPRWESAIARGDSDEFRRVADILDLIKNEGAKSPLLAICTIFKRASQNSFFEPGEWPFTTSKLRKWIAEETGKEYPTNKVREAATQVGIPLIDGRGKKKKTAGK